MTSFSALLDLLISAPPDRRPSIEQLIRDTFERRRAVLALDMSGFTMSVRRDGILSYLVQVRRMQKLTMPIVKSHQGDVVKYVADNLLAVFKDSRQAVLAAVAMNRAAVEDATTVTPTLAFSIGIDVGDLLLLESVDCFGDPVNLAYKLGEDIARPGEILITHQVSEELGDVFPFPLREMQLSVSGVEIVAYQVSYGED